MEIFGNSAQLLKVCLFLSCILLDFFPASGQMAGNLQNEIEYYRNRGIQPLINSSQAGDFSPGTYLIPHDILIEKGKVMTIYPGTKILFTQNAMLVVNGTLVCTGTKEAPVVFRKLENQNYFHPIDTRVETRWDGIYLPDSAVLKMKNTIISDSKYGIVISGKDVGMVFDSVRFVNNKFQNVKIGDRMMKIAENSPIVFHYPEQEGVFVEPVIVKNATETIQQKRDRPHETAYPAMRIGMGVAGGAGLAIAIAGFIVHNKYSTRSDDDAAIENKYRSYSNAGSVVAIGGAILFGIGAAGFTWTFFF